MFMERVPELYIAIFGALKLGAVVGPLFSAFGPDPVKDRLFDRGQDSADATCPASPYRRHSSGSFETGTYYREIQQK